MIKIAIFLLAITNYNANAFSYTGSTEFSNNAMTGEFTFPNYIQTFANAMIQNITASAPGQNIVISPLSLQIIMTLLSMGAQGQTLQIMQEALSLTAMSSQVTANDFHNIMQPFINNADIDIANAIYVKQSYAINSAFESVAMNQFYSTVQPITFDANGANTINAYVANQTNGKIQNMVSANAFTPYTAMILIDAVYFHGSWVHKFPVENTSNGTFYHGTCISDNAATVQMMNQQAYFRYVYSSKLDAQVLELPYRKLNNVTLTMTIILPKKCETLHNLVAALNGFDLNTLSGQQYQLVDVTIPKFSIQYSTSLNNELTQMGLGNIFQEGVANFSGLLAPSSSGSIPQLYVSSVLQKATIDVSEIGTVAAAATKVSASIVSSSASTGSNEPIEFNANHPFAFYITTPTSILFYGKYCGIIDNI